MALVVPAAAQTPSGTVAIEVRSGERPLEGADVVVNGITRRTDLRGHVSIPAVPGALEVTVAREGYVPTTVTIQVLSPGQPPVVVDLQPVPTSKEDVVVVASTRTSRGLDDQPLRVDVLPRDEIEEKMLMTPGDIVMMMNEMGGMRVQATSPSLGAASVRIQGMRGRYTRFLSDGLPLFGEVGGLGLLQIPPMDLGQVEVIKGVASSMYGAGAMGGVVNLIARKPGSERVREFLINRSSRDGTDAVGFYGGPLSQRWGLTLLGGGHWQERIDANDDTWSDLPKYARGVFRPRIYWNGGDGRTFFATTGVTIEDREGGTAPETVLPVANVPYRERLDTRRFDVGMVGQTPIKQRVFMTARAAFAQQRQTHTFGDIRERDRHEFAFGEVAVRGVASRHAWVAGAAVERDVFGPVDLPQFAYQFTIPGVFVQDDVEIARWVSLSASARLDHHAEYGTFLSPRVAALFRSGRWNSRVSIGTGFFGPSALTEETEAAGLSRLTIPRPLRAEEGRSASFDISRTDGPLSYTVTLFASRIHHPIEVERTVAFTLTNAADRATNTGVELLGTLRHEPFALTTTYTFVRAREPDADRGMVDAALTPRHSAGLVGMWEREGVGRVGLEVYYTGVQRLEANPFGDRSRPYVIVGLLAERQFGAWRVFVNGENLTDVRQTRWQPLIRPTQAPDGRWTVDAWAPLEGRNVNGGIRVGF
jgi:iron complex outermembrane receptor protein